ncbi:unnamed protein product, partial [Staurois parvus]
CATFRSTSHCWCVSIFCHRVLADLRASHSCCQAPNLPMGPYTASSCCCQVQSLSWVPVRPPIAAVSIATLCHVPLSGLLTLLVVFSIFVIGCCMASHCCCLHRHTVAPHSGFGPRDCPK